MQALPTLVTLVCLDHALDHFESLSISAQELDLSECLNLDSCPEAVSRLTNLTAPAACRASCLS